MLLCVSCKYKVSQQKSGFMLPQKVITSLKEPIKYSQVIWIFLDFIVN